jgi:23S rRNA (uridine2552-2'-O)-methyltransferase
MASSSKRWLQEHHKDQYVKQAREQGYPSRAAYKLLELNQKDHLFKPGMLVVDLGAAPGGWSMVASDMVGAKGKVVAVDLLPMQIPANTVFIQGDFTDDAVLQTVLQALDNKPVDLVISDMAPNISGNKSVDQPRSIYLLELALDFAKRTLKPKGTLLMKAFQGEGLDELVRCLKNNFKQVKFRKPNASRARSREVYLLATDFLLAKE